MSNQPSANPHDDDTSEHEVHSQEQFIPPEEQRQLEEEVSQTDDEPTIQSDDTTNNTSVQPEEPINTDDIVVEQPSINVTVASPQEEAKPKGEIQQAFLLETEEKEETLMELMNPDRKHKVEKHSTMSDLIREEIDTLNLNVVPELGTNIEDLLHQLEAFETGEKQCWIVGLGYECRTFANVNDLWTHVKTTYEKRAGQELEDENLHALQHSQTQIEPIWIDIQSPSAEDMKLIQKLFGLHPLTTEDCINNDTGEKWEFFESYMFVVFTGQIQGSTTVESTTQLNIIVFEDYVLTIHDQPIKGMDLVIKRIGKEFETDVQPVKRKKSVTLREGDTSSPRPKRTQQTQRKRTVIPSADWVMYAFLDAMVDMYIPYVDSLVQEVENLDELVFMLDESEHDDLLRRVGLTKKNIVTLRRLLFPKQKMTTYLVSQELEYLSNTIQVYMRDVLDHLANAIDKLESSKENLNHTHSNYLTKVQIDIAEASMRTDDFLNRMTVIAALFVPLTLVSGIWGMNVWVPGQDVETLEWFFGIVCSLLVFSLVVIIYLRKRLVNL